MNSMEQPSYVFCRRPRNFHVHMRRRFRSCSLESLGGAWRAPALSVVPGLRMVGVLMVHLLHFVRSVLLFGAAPTHR